MRPIKITAIPKKEWRFMFAYIYSLLHLVFLATSSLFLNYLCVRLDCDYYDFLQFIKRSDSRFRNFYVMLDSAAACTDCTDDFTVFHKRNSSAEQHNTPIIGRVQTI